MSWIDLGIIALIQIIITTLLGFWFKNYYPAYFTQKGKNLADKEDISELTVKIESVKKEFTKDLESFKTKLSYDREYKLKQKIEERDAIYKFWESICAWNFTLAVFNNNFKTTKEALTYRAYMDDLSENLRSSISSLTILQLKVDDEKLLKISSLIYQLYNQMAGDISGWISALEKLDTEYHNLDDFIDLKKKFEEKYDKFFESNKIKDSYIKRAKELLTLPISDD